MKAFLAAIIVLIILAFTLTTLPEDLARRIQDSANIEGFIKDRVIGAAAKNLLGGKSPEETRLELIEKIEDSLGTLEGALQENQVTKSGTKPNTTATESAKESPTELISEARDMLEELKSRNADEGFLKEAAEKIISGVLPSSNICPVRSPEQKN